GDTLRDFAFALMVGIGSGAYSSIFIAAPFLSWLKEREPEYARREGEPFDRAATEAAAEEAEEAVTEEPVPALAPAAPGERPRTNDAKRERRSQRRKARPH